MSKGEPGSPVVESQVVGGWSNTLSLIVGFMHSGVRKDWVLLDAELGQGRYGVVREARNRRTGQKAAVKIMNRRDKGAKEVKLMMREIEMMSSIKHPNCIEQYATYESANSYYIVMEALEGGSLAERIVENRTFTENLAAHVFVQLVGAIDYLHSIGIVHRDLKPENIMFKTHDPYSRIKIVDFGLGRFVDAEGLTTGRKRLWSRTGSPNFVAPEVISKAGYGMECDVWSAGVILYILLFGVPPFDQKTIESKFMHIKRAAFAFPEEKYHSIPVSDSAKDLVQHVLVLDCSERYSCKECLKHVWVQRYLSSTLLKNETFKDSLRKIGANTPTINITPTPSEEGERSESDTLKGQDDAEMCDALKEELELTKVRSVLDTDEPEQVSLAVYYQLMNRGCHNNMSADASTHSAHAHPFQRSKSADTYQHSKSSAA